ncbi:hypothetical protein OND84_000488 [Morganella morganii]|uniref:hypothetical protein n=1 Tax=Morganella morganii TaxID=582 RepID=UPI002ADEA131|nr:hypothetical protein [Morganella morganii]
MKKLIIGLLLSLTSCAAFAAVDICKNQSVVFSLNKLVIPNQGWFKESIDKGYIVGDSEYVNTLVNDYEKRTSYCEGVTFFVGKDLKPMSARFMYRVEYQISDDLETLGPFEFTSVTYPVFDYPPSSF